MPPSDNTTIQLVAHKGERLELRGVSLRQVARVIYGLNSCLLEIAAEQSADSLVLIYIFAVADAQQAFQVSATDAAIDSIADLYPEAAAYEQFWANRCGLHFQTGSEP